MQIGGAELDHGLGIGLGLLDVRPDEKQAGAGEADQRQRQSSPEDATDRRPWPGEASKQQAQQCQPARDRGAFGPDDGAHLSAEDRTRRIVSGGHVNRAFTVIDAG